MSKNSKAYKAAAELVDKDRLYRPIEAAKLAKETSSKNYDATVDVAFRLGVDPRKADQLVRGTVSLPHGTGKDVRVAVFAEGEKATEAEAAGADIVGTEALLEAINAGNLDFDVAIATPDQMAKVGRVARVLGPRGLMPNPKTGTVTMDVASAVREVKAGKIDFKVDKTGIVHAAIGKVSFTAEQIFQNALEFLNVIVKLKPQALKGTYIKSISLCSTMSPGVKVDVKTFSAAE